MFGFRPDQILLNICMKVNHLNKNFQILDDYGYDFHTINKGENNDNGQYILGAKSSLKLVPSS